jgi:hypothetical protein
MPKYCRAISKNQFKTEKLPAIRANFSKEKARYDKIPDFNFS